MPNTKLNTFEMLAVFFMRIRLNLYEEDIAYRFDVHRTTVSRCFYRLLDVMHAKTVSLDKVARERDFTWGRERSN